MKIKILGSGCPTCKRLEQHVIQTLEELKITADIEKVTGIKDIMAYGVLSTPGLVIDDEVVSTGRLLFPKDIKKILEK
jgi:small redox-active disulfide protein 2